MILEHVDSNRGRAEIEEIRYVLTTVDSGKQCNEHSLDVLDVGLAIRGAEGASAGGAVASEAFPGLEVCKYRMFGGLKMACSLAERIVDLGGIAPRPK